MEDRNNLLDEEQYNVMPEKRDTRPCQIPLRRDRFLYLTEEYTPQEGDNPWIMFHHPGHFMIYDKESRDCICDATYTILHDPHGASPFDIVAVVYDLRITPKKHRLYKRGPEDFTVVADLIFKDL